MTIEAMKQALEALEHVHRTGDTQVFDLCYADKVIPTLRAAIEQPRQWQGLTDEEIKEIIGPWGDTPIKGYTRKLFDQIEAKLKEKNG
jgi:hypothetical protein